MALAAVKITVGQSLGDGRYSSVVKGSSVPDITTILDDITTALGNASGSTDSTDDITTVQTDATALTDAIDADVTVVWDGEVVTTKNQLLAALRTTIAAVEGGYGGLT